MLAGKPTVLAAQTSVVPLTEAEDANTLVAALAAPPVFVSCSQVTLEAWRSMKQ